MGENEIVPIKGKKIYVDTAHLPELREAMKKRGWIVYNYHNKGMQFDLRTSCRIPNSIFCKINRN